MKENFEHMSAWSYAVAGLLVLSVLMSPLTGLLAMTGIMAILALFAILTIAVPSSFEADDRGVTFTLLFFKRRISYSDISEIGYYRDKYHTRYSSDYTETISFTCGERVYAYKRRMDIDMDEVAQDPKRLEEQFENSMFSKLKRYIEKNTENVQ